MSMVLVLTTLVDAVLVAAFVWLVRRADRSQDAGLATQRAAMARFRAELADLLADAERRTRGLDHVLAMREATLRVLVQTSTRPDESAAEAPAAASPAEVRLLRDLELSLEPAEPTVDRIATASDS
jgi:hypothetical protein